MERTSYVVGGCVRDSILGREPHDWDICTPALPGELLVEFEEKGYRVIPTGLTARNNYSSSQWQQL